MVAIIEGFHCVPVRVSSAWSQLSFLYMQDDGYTVTHRIITCGLSTTYIIYFSLALVYKVIIHVIGLVLAFLTRKVKIDPLNDSRYSAAIIYCSCIMLVLAVIVVFALSGVNVYAGVWTSFVFVEVCVFLGLTFIPKVIVNSSFNILTSVIASYACGISRILSQ